jgi:porphobilinogen synthase
MIQHSRPRRLRASAAIRDLVRETRLHASDLIAPLFIVEGSGIQDPIPSMPGIFRMSLDIALN